MTDTPTDTEMQATANRIGSKAALPDTLPPGWQEAIDAVDKDAFHQLVYASATSYQLRSHAQDLFVKSKNAKAIREYVSKVERYEVEGHAVVFTSQCPEFTGYGTRNKSQWRVTIDDVWRANLTYPHGWGVTPHIAGLAQSYQDRRGRGTHSVRATGKGARERIATQVIELFKKEELPSRREIARQREEAQQEAVRKAEQRKVDEARWATEREAARVDKQERKRKAMDALESFAIRLNLTEEEQDGLPHLRDFVRNA